MSKPRKPKTQPGLGPRLRPAAEAQLARSRRATPKLKGKTAPEIIHEQQVHQIELEMQNEELKRAHLDLEESRDRFLDLYDFGPSGYFTFTRGGRIIELNLTGAALLGVPRAKLIRCGLGSFIASEDRDRWERHLASVLQSAGPSPGPGQKQSCELKLVREDGSTFHACLESVRLKRSEGRESAKAGGGSAVIRTALSDITERVRAERALQEAHDRVVAVLESITDAFFSLDREWRFTYVNREAVRILGLSREQLVGHNIWKKFPPAVGSAFQREYERAVAKNKTAHFEAFYPPFGVWFEVHAYPSAMGLSVYFNDITERKRTEDELRKSEEFTRRVIESSKDCIKVLDLEGHLLSMSEGGQKLMEIDDIAPYLNQSWIDFWKGPDAKAALGAVSKARKGHAGSFCGFCATAKGGLKWWEVIVSPIKDANGKVTRLLAVSRDITERKQAEAASETAAGQRRFALEAAGMGAWDYRFDTGEVFWDERCRNQWGIAHGAQIDYAAAIAAIHPEDRAATDAAVKQALAGTDGGAYHREFRVVWPDDSVHWIGSHGQVYFEGNGKQRRVVRFIGANRDITERKRMEDVQMFMLQVGYLKSHEDFFRALARYLARSLEMDFVCIDRLVGDGLAAQTVAMYCDGKFEDNVAYALKDTPCGEAAGKMICCYAKNVRRLFPKDVVLQELRAESYVGTTLWGFDCKPIGLIAVIGRKPLANPGLAESILKLVAARAAGELERQQAQETLQRAHDELELRVQERTAELQQTNENLRREVEIRRQTEQHLSEAELRYRTVADFTYDWEYWVTPEHVMRYCSPSCERITGYTAAEFMAGPSLLQQIVHPEDAELWQKHRHEAFAAPDPKCIQFRLHRRDGGVRWVEHACQPVLGEDGVFQGIRASNRDITGRKEEELQTQQLRKELAHVTRVTTAGQLAASLAHELNQPLAAIVCNAHTAEQLLTAKPPKVAELREVLDDIAQDSERAGGVIHRLRAMFTKTGQERSVLQINKIIEETIALLRNEFVSKGVSTELQLARALPKVLGDPIGLQQVVVNLIVNALEAMAELPPASHCLHISTSRESPALIRVSFRDFGPGIPAPQLSRLFEPFFTTKADGMGMGLAISRSIIEAHDGCLQAANNPDCGATFHFTLPIHQGEHA